MSRDMSQDCWLFLGNLASKGYGRYSQQKAHRLSYESLVGPIPKGMLVLHKCNVRRCINPKHLYAGTDSDNMRDMAIAETHSKLTSKIVLNLRKLKFYGKLNSTMMAKKHGVGLKTIYNAVNNLTWRHL